MTLQKKAMADELETQLAGVLEQDGITMASPQGVGRRAQRVKRKRSSGANSRTPIFFSDARPALDMDSIAELDVAAVGLLVNTPAEISERPVSISRNEKKRSEYVLSLREVSFDRKTTPEDELLSLHEAFASDHQLDAAMQEPAVYGTLTNDLTVEGHDPHLLAEQFTHEDFFTAYRFIYGRFDRIGSFFRVMATDAASLFHRIERVERRIADVERLIADEIRDTVTVIETPRLSPVRALAGFIALLFVVTLPANALVLYRSAMETQDATRGAGEQAINELVAAASAKSPQGTIESLRRASSRFREADAVLSESSALAIGLASVVPNKYRSARALIEVGDKSSEAGRLLALGFEKVFADPNRRLDERLDVLAAYARGVLPMLSNASRAAATIDPEILPEDKREQFTTLASRLESATAAIREFAGMSELLTHMLGKERSRNYLLVFQNYTELRPTGGFMGSIAEVTLDRGAVTKLRVPKGGTYDLKGQFLSHVISPSPLHLINPHWQFQDANWFPDFPTTANKLRWFWSKSGQPSLDGIIALNASLVERLLDITGPIDMPEYGKVVDSSNFLFETQKAVEIEYDKIENAPKKFIGDLTEALQARMKFLTREDWLKVGALVSEGLQTKEVQVFLTNAEEEALVERYGWSGRLKQTSGDSLAIIEANIAGQKTDGVIDETVDHLAAIQPDGRIINTVKLTRTHKGTKGELFRGVRNVSFVRLYVPQGSKLVTAEGFESPAPELFKQPDDDYVPDTDIAKINEKESQFSSGATIGVEGDRTVFGGWLQLDPGKTQTITYKYELPFTVSDIHGKLEASPDIAVAAGARGAYSLLLTSQSGKMNRKMTTTINVPEEWNIAWTRGAARTDSNGAAYAGQWDRDRFVALLLSPITELHVQEKTQTTGAEAR